MRTPACQCPYCGHVADAISPADGDDDSPPTPDSAISLCLNCAGILCFNDDLTIRRPTAAELRMLKRDPGTWKAIQRAQLAVRITPQHPRRWVH